MKIVYIVHCVDAEGPLYESIDATFQRLETLYNIKDIEPSRENLQKIQNREIDLGPVREKVADNFSPHLLNYLSTWDQVDEMLKRVISKTFRDKMKDSFGGGWVYNWHCVDHIGYEYNPRKRDIGYLNIFDHYSTFLSKNNASQDAIHFHFHPMPFNKDASVNCTSYLNSPTLYEILCRRLIDRQWFPSVNRAGFHVERPDSHWFLEQWIPFDISNISAETSEMSRVGKDFQNGRMGDWRRAPKDWSIYHPSHDDYQQPGHCRRYIARILNVLGRLASINEYEVRKAFSRAHSGLPTLMGVTGHDFRDLGAEVDYVRELIKKISPEFPEVKFKFSEVKEAFRRVLWSEQNDFGSLELDISFVNDPEIPYMEIKTVSGEVFGPQPFLAIKTKSKRYLHDNLDFSMDGKSWTYSFYNSTVLLDEVESVGIAANDKYGNIFVKCLKMSDLNLVER